MESKSRGMPAREAALPGRVASARSFADLNGAFGESALPYEQPRLSPQLRHL